MMWLSIRIATMTALTRRLPLRRAGGTAAHHLTAQRAGGMEIPRPPLLDTHVWTKSAEGTETYYPVCSNKFATSQYAVRLLSGEHMDSVLHTLYLSASTHNGLAKFRNSGCSVQSCSYRE